MKQLPISSWTLFIICTVGLSLMLVAERPELNTSHGRTTPGQVVEVVAHTLTWGAAAALTVRMIRSARRAMKTDGEPEKHPGKSSNKPVS